MRLPVPSDAPGTASAAHPVARAGWLLRLLRLLLLLLPVLLLLRPGPAC